MTPLKWRAEIGRRAKLHFEKDKRILAAFFYGSSADPTTMDRWSDVDLMYIVRDADFLSFGFADAFLGDEQPNIFSKHQDSGEDFRLNRICLNGFRRLDLVIHPKNWLTSNRGFPRISVIASRLPNSDLERCSAPSSAYKPVEDRPSLEEIQEFLHKLQLATVRIMRQDVLIGAHLTLDLYRDALVVLMKRRDNEGRTTHHRYGGFGNATAFELLGDLRCGSTKDLLESIWRIGTWFLESSGHEHLKLTDNIERLIDECHAGNSKP